MSNLKDRYLSCNITDAADTTVADFLAAAKKYNGQSGGIAFPYHLGLLAANLVWTLGAIIPLIRRRSPGLLRPATFKAGFPGATTPNDRAREKLGWTPRLAFDQAWQDAVRGDSPDAS